MLKNIVMCNTVYITQNKKSDGVDFIVLRDNDRSRKSKIRYYFYHDYGPLPFKPYDIL